MMRNAPPLALLLLLCCLSPACDGTAGPEDMRVSSETHFLTTCLQGCPEGFQCLCGVCSRPCSASESCSDLPGDTTMCFDLDMLVQAHQCGSENQVAAQLCHASCTQDIDCSSIGPDHACFLGYCARPAPDLCASITCPEGSICSNNTCITEDQCAAITCPVGWACVDSACVDPEVTSPSGCAAITCPAGWSCVNARCVDPQSGDLCPNITCPTDHVCVDNTCVPNG